MNLQRQAILAALPSTLPVMAGYLPLGAAFGLLFGDLGYHWGWASAVSLFVFAGSAQFLAVGLLAAHAGIVETGIALFLLNIRHLVYGFSMLSRYAAAGWRKPYLVFGLTDETFALLSTAKAPVGVNADDFRLWVTALNQCYWVVGTTAGAIAGSALSLNTTGLEFALTALFAVLLVEQILALREWFPFLLAGFAGLGAIALAGPERMLLAALAVTFAILLVRANASWSQ